MALWGDLIAKAAKAQANRIKKANPPRTPSVPGKPTESMPRVRPQLPRRSQVMEDDPRIATNNGAKLRVFAPPGSPETEVQGLKPGAYYSDGSFVPWSRLPLTQLKPSKYTPRVQV